jgi:chromosome segregation ATPase
VQTDDNYPDDRHYNDFDSKVIELEEREREIEQAYKELQEQMDNFNKELEEREIILDEKELTIEKQEKEIKKKFENFQIIEASLIESKIQVEDLRTFTIPELEKQSNYLENLLQELSDKKSELDILVDNLQHDLSLISQHKSGLAVIEEDRSQDISNDSGHYGHNEINEIAEDLELKIMRVKEREEELDYSLAQLERDKAEVIRAAEIVKKAHDDVEEKRRKLDKDLQEEKEKIKNQIIKIENGTRLLTTKEAEIFAFKKKLEEKNQMLIIKEKEINSRLSKNSSQSSSIIEER